MSDYYRHLERLADVFFNGRKADKEVVPDPATKIEAPISMTGLIERRVSQVRCKGKMYRVTVEEVEAGK